MPKEMTRTKKIAGGIALAFLLTGCRENYLAEKEFWKAERKLLAIKKADVERQGPELLTPAITAFETIVTQYPTSVKSAESLIVISNLKLRQKKYEEAIKTLGILIQNFSHLAEKTSEARYGIAGIYESMGDWEKAEAAYWETAEYHPLQPKGLYAPVRVMLHYKKAKDASGLQGAYVRALDYYERMLKQVGPIRLSIGIKNHMALAHITNGEWKKARDIWLSIEKEFPQAPSAPLSLLMASELSAEYGDFDGAIQLGEDFVSRYEGHALKGKACLGLGFYYQLKKEFEKSREWFQQALDNVKTSSETADIKLLIGRSHQQEGSWSEAMKIYEEIESKFSDSSAGLQVPLLVAAYHESMGQTEMAGNILDKAIQGYQKLMDSAPDPKQAAYAERLQNAALVERKDWQKLITNFDNRMEKEIAPLRKGSWMILKALVIENHLKDKDQAVSLYQTFLKEFPDHPLTGLAKNHEQLLLQAA